MRRSERVGHGVRAGTWAVFVGVLMLSGCEGLLDVDTNPELVAGGGALSLQETLIGGLAGLQRSVDGVNLNTGLFGDEFESAGPGNSERLFGARQVSAEEEFGLGGLYVPLQRMVSIAGIGKETLLAGEFPEMPSEPTDSREYARLSFYEGFGKLWLADAYCTVAFRGTGPELTSHEAYEVAEADLTEAIEAAGVDEDVRQAALVGRARIRLRLGDEAGAVADARAVDPSFEFMVEYSTATNEQRNGIFVSTQEARTYTVARRFRELTLDDTGIPDPRTLVEFRGPANVATEPLWVPLKVPSSAASLRMASGDEAQYIIAEVEGGDVAVDIINAVRARHGISEEWAPSGTGPNEVRDKLIEERFRTLFLEGVHMGDLRHYIDKYDVDLFPQDTPQGIPVGDQTCIPMPALERENNPDL